MSKAQNYWKSFAGIPLYKVEWYAKRFLYKALGLTLPKLKDQQDYWAKRGEVYRQEIIASGYLEREVFFQDMLVEFLKEHNAWESFFEAGCGFGWNVRRIKEEFASARVGGVDFSHTQIENSIEYMDGIEHTFKQGDICEMPLEDNAYDVGFSLGVFMNIHPDKIQKACSEMIRTSSKYIIHLEWDADNTTPELRSKRAPKTNIVSHDYKSIYESLGAKVLEFKTHEDFGDAYRERANQIKSDLDRWEGFEGPEKYIWIVVEVPQ